MISYFEWVQGKQEFYWDEIEIEERFENIMINTYREIESKANEKNISIRDAALMLAMDKVSEAMKLRGMCP